MQPIELRIANQVLEARNFVIEGFDTRAAITGKANLRTGALNFDIDGTTDLKLLDAFLPGSNPGGQIQTSIAVRGTSDQPDLDGVVNMRRMQLQISEPPISIADVNAEIQLQRDRIQITS